MLVLQIPDISVSDNLNDGFFIREGGLNIQTNLSDGVQAYRNSLVLILQILQLENGHLLLPHQLHDNEVLVATSQNIDSHLDQTQSQPELSIEADIIITNPTKVGIGIIIADGLLVTNPFDWDWYNLLLCSVNYY